MPDAANFSLRVVSVKNKQRMLEKPTIPFVKRSVAMKHRRISDHAKYAGIRSPIKFNWKSYEIVQNAYTNSSIKPNFELQSPRLQSTPTPSLMDCMPQAQFSNKESVGTSKVCPAIGPIGERKLEAKEKSACLRFDKNTRRQRGCSQSRILDRESQYSRHRRTLAEPTMRRASSTKNLAARSDASESFHEDVGPAPSMSRGVTLGNKSKCWCEQPSKSGCCVHANTDYVAIVSFAPPSDINIVESCKNEHIILERSRYLTLGMTPTARTLSFCKASTTRQVMNNSPVSSFRCYKNVDVCFPNIRGCKKNDIIDTRMREENSLHYAVTDLLVPGYFPATDDNLKNIKLVKGYVANDKEIGCARRNSTKSDKNVYSNARNSTTDNGTTNVKCDTTAHLQEHDSIVDDECYLNIAGFSNEVPYVDHLVSCLCSTHLGNDSVQIPAMNKTGTDVVPQPTRSEKPKENKFLLRKSSSKRRPRNTSGPRCNLWTTCLSGSQPDLGFTIDGSILA
ncbi:uncharacterized protein LOC108681630 [Hyalella azteca]|uniref:Uncharacterized protein LOC108681630 n=1 Tax=Hyalella azteca TaxID=294128 RepID=A0A8B7PL97_HYAAZ|nr:uncharacterized protein LOC108681630 [Hyalella azteca]